MPPAVLLRRLRPLAVFVSLILSQAPPAFADRTLVLQRFAATIDVATDGSIQVEESITPRFTGAWNGIYRLIPIQYETPQGFNYTLRLGSIAIVDDSGHPLKYESSVERHYRKLKVFVPGAADTTKTVVIRYRVANALRFFDEHDELYWNVTGDEWTAPIQSASAVVHLPAGVDGVRTAAFTGGYGSNEPATVDVNGASVRVESGRPLNFREGLTVVVGWNPGVVHRPTALERTAGTIYSNLPLAIPPFVFAGMFMLWRAKGRDPKVAPITPQYQPPGEMTPAEVGTLVDGKPDMRDITATIVDLAVRGFLHVTEEEHTGLLSLFSGRDYSFQLTRPSTDWGTLKLHEIKLLAGMFGALGTDDQTVTLSQLKNKFYKDLPGIRDDLYSMLVDRGLYTARPDRVRGFYIGVGIVLGLLLALSSGGLLELFGMQPASAIVAGIATGLVIAGFGWLMPARTAGGTRELEKVLGFQEFLSRVDADRLKTMVTGPELFEKFLPYAMALGVESNWARAFEGIDREPPRWYSGSGGGQTFRPGSFASDMNRMSATAASVMASAPRSSGGSGFRGGSSGGGFGGGGGGGF